MEQNRRWMGGLVRVVRPPRSCTDGRYRCTCVLQDSDLGKARNSWRNLYLFIFLKLSVKCSWVALKIDFFFLSRFSNSDILNRGWLIARFSVANPRILGKWETGRHGNSQGPCSHTPISSVIGYLVWKGLRLGWEIGEHYYLRGARWGQLLWNVKLFLWNQRPHCVVCWKLWLILNLFWKFSARKATSIIFTLSLKLVGNNGYKLTNLVTTSIFYCDKMRFKKSRLSQCIGITFYLFNRKALTRSYQHLWVIEIQDI